MRRLAIENSIGERLSLVAPKNLWLINISGLGMAMNRQYESVEPGFFIGTSEEENQMSVTGTLVFRRNNVYTQYMEITDWLICAESLRLVYAPEGEDGTEYYRDIEISSIDKSEKKLSQWLECPVTISPLTPWYDRYRMTIEISPQAGNYKRYEYRYDYRYAASAVPNSADFEISGHYNGDIEMEAQGPLLAPVFTIENSNTGKVYGKVDLETSAIGSDETLYYSSRRLQPGIWKSVDGEKVDILDMVELYADVPAFIRVPPNTPLTATISVSSPLITTAAIHVYRYYRTR